jgi:hypothetical protein
MNSSMKKEEKSMFRTFSFAKVITTSLVMATALTGCGGMFERDADPTEEQILLGQKGRIMWEAGLQYVKIVDVDKAGVVNDHPDSLSSEQMKTLLSNVYANKRILLRDRQVPVFSVGELQVLAPAMSNGFTQAAAGEDITFVSIGTHKSTLASEQMTTSGRAFIQNGRLNIVFGKLHELYSDKDIATGQAVDRRINPLLPGKRGVIEDLDATPVLDSGMSFYIDPDTGKERRDWLVIDIATVLAKAAENKSSTSGLVSPELLEDVARSKQETGNLREDVGNLKEIIFDMSDEIDRLKKEIEALKADSQ